MYTTSGVTFTLKADIPGTYRIECLKDDDVRQEWPSEELDAGEKIEHQCSITVGGNPGETRTWRVRVYPRPADDNPWQEEEWPPTAEKEFKVQVPDQSPCADFKAQFDGDVTIPDGTELTPGQVFTKTWRVRNIGECAWEPGMLVLELVDGGGIEGARNIYVELPKPVESGSEAEISIALTVPPDPGEYTATWELRSLWRDTLETLTVKITLPTPTPTPTPTSTPMPSPTQTPVSTEAP